MPSQTTICTQCRWMRHDSKCTHPRFDLISYVDGRRDLPECRTVNYGQCQWFTAAGRVRLLFRNHAFVVCLIVAMVIGGVYGILANIPEPEVSH